MRALRNVTESDCECRHENGIFYDDGKVALVVGDHRDGFQVSCVTTLEDLLRTEPEGRTHLDFQIVSEMPKGTAYAGETSYGGAGFFAFRTSSGFAWVLHLDNMNNPISLSRDGDMVVGLVDSPHPHGSIFKIPCDEPELFSVAPNKG